MKDRSYYLGLLKQDLWILTIGTKNIVQRKIYYNEISIQICSKTGERLHWQTIRNFFEDRNHPSPVTLRILTTFLLGSKGDLKDFQHYIESKRFSKSTLQKVTEFSIIRETVLPGFLFLLILSALVILVSVSPTTANQTVSQSAPSQIENRSPSININPPLLVNSEQELTILSTTQVCPEHAGSEEFHFYIVAVENRDVSN